MDTKTIGLDEESVKQKKSDDGILEYEVACMITHAASDLHTLWKQGYSPDESVEATYRHAKRILDHIYSWKRKNTDKGNRTSAASRNGGK